MSTSILLVQQSRSGLFTGVVAVPPGATSATLATVMSAASIVAPGASISLSLLFSTDQGINRNSGAACEWSSGPLAPNDPYQTPTSPGVGTPVVPGATHAFWALEVVPSADVGLEITWTVG